MNEFTESVSLSPVQPVKSGISTSSSPASMTEVPRASLIIQIAKNGRAFQAKEVLQAIVEKEKRRIQDEQIAWRIGGAIVGGLLGMSDGFDFSDIFVGMTFSSLGGLGHQVASREQLEFLRKCNAAWMVTAGSPVELASRIGPARSRVILYGDGWDEPRIFNHHQGPRGDYLVPLGLASWCARGFLQQDSKQAMLEVYDPSNIEILSNQLYPDSDRAIRLDSVRKISNERAFELDQYAVSFVRHAEPVAIEIEGNVVVAYRVPIPVHSDF